MLYVFSTIILFIVILLKQKTKQKLNIIKTMILQVIAFMAYNALVCYGLNGINIPITLVNLAIVNFIIAIIVLGNIIKTKEIQTYELVKKDLLAMVLILMVAGVSVSINFRGISRIRYISMDAVNHYKAAREFSENTTLFSKATKNTTTSKCFMPMGYVNVGILFKISKPYIGTIQLYQVYILFEAISYYLVGMVFYFCVQKKLKRKGQWGIGILCSIFYLIGYPLNSFICGFHYLILGILYATAIFEVFTNEIERETLKFSDMLMLVTLLNLGLIFSYALFCPAIYMAEFLFILKQGKQNKKQKILFIAVALVLTGIMGCDISLYQRITELGTVGIEQDGWIYQNSISNMILFLPFAIYYLITIRREEGHRFEKSVIALFVLCLLVLLLGTKLHLCSKYYFYKNYYILWFLMFYMNVSAMAKLWEGENRKKAIVAMCCICYVFVFLLFICLVETPIQTEIEAKQSYMNIMEIYTFNKTNMAIEIPFVSKEELQLFQKLEEEIGNEWKNKPSILLVANTTQEKWLQALTGYYHSIYPNVVEDVTKWNEGQYQYLIILEKRDLYKEIKERINLEKAESIYQNAGGSIYKIRNGE